MQVQQFCLGLDRGKEMSHYQEVFDAIEEPQCVQRTTHSFDNSTAIYCQPIRSHPLLVSEHGTATPYNMPLLPLYFCPITTIASDLLC